jgi:hypothetical protein
VCITGNFNDDAAHAACRQLGHTDIAWDTPVGFGSGGVYDSDASLPVVMTWVSCPSGQEVDSLLHGCTWNDYQAEKCTHAMDVWVQCF